MPIFPAHPLQHVKDVFPGLEAHLHRGQNDAVLRHLLPLVGVAGVHIVQNGGARDGDGAGSVIVHLLGAAAGQSQQHQHR